MDRTLEDIRERFAEQIREARALKAALAQQKAKTNAIMNEIRAERQRMRDLVEQSHDVLWKHMRQHLSSIEATAGKAAGAQDGRDVRGYRG